MCANLRYIKLAYCCNDDDDQDEVSNVEHQIIQFRLKQTLSMQAFHKSILKESRFASLAPDSETVYKDPSEPRRVTAPHWVAADSYELGNILAGPEEAVITIPVEMELYKLNTVSPLSLSLPCLPTEKVGRDIYTRDLGSNPDTRYHGLDMFDPLFSRQSEWSPGGATVATISNRRHGRIAPLDPPLVECCANTLSVNLV